MPFTVACCKSTSLVLPRLLPPLLLVCTSKRLLVLLSRRVKSVKLSRTVLEFDTRFSTLPRVAACSSGVLNGMEDGISSNDSFAAELLASWG